MRLHGRLISSRNIVVKQSLTLLGEIIFEEASLKKTKYSSVPNRRACSFIILRKNSPLHGLIWVCTFIDFEKKNPPARLFGSH